MVENGMILDGYWGKNDSLNCGDYDDDEPKDNDCEIDLEISIQGLTANQAEEIADEIQDKFQQLSVELDEWNETIIIQGSLDDRNFRKFYNMVEGFGLPTSDKMILAPEKKSIKK